MFMLKNMKHVREKQTQLHSPTKENTYEIEHKQNLIPEALSKFNSSKSRGMSTRVSEAGLLSIISTDRNGNRIILSKTLLEELNRPSSLQFSFSDDEMALGEELPENINSFQIKKQGVKGVIYSTSLVKEITHSLQLDFTRKASITFRDARYVEYCNKKIAIVSVPKDAGKPNEESLLDE